MESSHHLHGRRASGLSGHFRSRSHSFSGRCFWRSVRLTDGPSGQSHPGIQHLISSSPKSIQSFAPPFLCSRITELEGDGVCHLALAVYRHPGGRRRRYGTLLLLRRECGYEGGLRRSFRRCNRRTPRRRQRSPQFASGNVGEGRLV